MSFREYRPAAATSQRSREFERECVDLMGEVVQVFGVPRSVGQIYGMLYSSPEPMSFSDIVKSLRISKGSVSQGLQLLRALGAVNSVSFDPGRRDYFAPELALRKLIAGVLRERLEPLLVASRRRMDKLRTIVNRESRPESREFLDARVKQLDTWSRQTKLMLPIVKTLVGSRKVAL